MFITFEGVEGSGKTTIIKLVEEELKKNYSVLISREPGGSRFAESIRRLLLDVKNKDITYHTEALLYAASRTQHLIDVIIPNKNKVDIILCDRFIDSSFAYQGYARKLGFSYIKEINSFALKHMPDITFYIDLDPKIGISRIRSREKNDRLDQEKITFHEKVREGYLEISKNYRDRIIVINGSMSIEKIVNRVLLEINKVKNEHR